MLHREGYSVSPSLEEQRRHRGTPLKYQAGIFKGQACLSSRVQGACHWGCWGWQWEYPWNMARRGLLFIIAGLVGLLECPLAQRLQVSTELLRAFFVRNGLGNLHRLDLARYF